MPDGYQQSMAINGQGHRVLRYMADETRLYLEGWFESDTDFDYRPNRAMPHSLGYYYLGGQRVAITALWFSSGISSKKAHCLLFSLSCAFQRLATTPRTPAP